MTGTPPPFMPTGLLIGTKGDVGDRGLQGIPGMQGPPGPGTGAGAWQATTSYTANQVVQAPDGSTIQRIANGTSRPAFDAAEALLWRAIAAAPGTIANAADLAAIAASASAQSTRRTLFGERASYKSGQWWIQRTGPNELHLLQEDTSETGCWWDWMLADKYGDAGMPGGTTPAVTSPGTLRAPRLRMLRRGRLMRAEHVGASGALPTGWAVLNPADPSQGYPQGVALSGSMTAGSATFTVTAGGPLSQNIHRSRGITIPGAGPGGADLVTTFQAAPTGSSATLAASASTSVTGVAVTLWPDYWTSDGTAGRTVTGAAHSCNALGFLGIRHSTTSGLMKVTVSDGSVANCLPTAQNVVDQGLYPNTILVANGGTLAPTDRVWASVAPKITYSEPICAGVWSTTASRQLTITATGYGSSVGVPGANLNKTLIAGWLWADGTETPALGSDMFVGEIDLLGLEANWVMNYSHDGGGAGASTFCGGEHGYELLQALPTISVNGVATTLSQWQAQAVTGEAKVSFVTTCRHPSAPSTDFWRTTYTYRLTRSGLVVQHVNEWLAPTTVSLGYPFMLPVNRRLLDQCQEDPNTTVLTFTGSNAQLAPTVHPTAVAFWSSTGSVMTALVCPEAQAWTNNWSGPTFVQDRPPDTGTLTAKAYIGRTSTPVAGDIWDNKATYVQGRNRAGTANMFPVS